ncbi:hypothetical protein ACFQZE_11250 [Paenibacillus sp. GCM10027627]|uniref:hypothetical protein n=1 Tax=unclassified Paenibacillus TaxID=185978 RepID=UPI00363BA315
MKLTNKKRSKTLAAGALLIAVMLTTSACGANATEKSGNGGPSESPAPTVQPTDNLPDDNGIVEPGTPTSDNTSGGQATPDSSPISAEGVYSGQIDSSSIEITVDGVASAYRIPEELGSVIESLPSDAKVKFEYIEKTVDSETDVKQLLLTKIEAVQ